MTKMLRRLLLLRAVEDAVGLKKTQIYEAMARGVFPRPINILGGKAVGWIEDEIIDYVEARIALRDKTAAAAVMSEPKRRPGRPRKAEASTEMAAKT
jgi:prophage regulatory protein